MKIVHSLTHDFNLAYSYCYGGSKPQKSMPLEVARKIVDFAFETVPSEKILEYSLKMEKHC